jgi:predicted ATP-dependent serine protease
MLLCAALHQVWERARRLGLLQPLSSSSSSSAGAPPDVRLLVENRVEAIAAAIVQLAPAAVVVDSIQTVALRDLAQRPGSITQVGLVNHRRVQFMEVLGAWGWGVWETTVAWGKDSLP